VIFKKLIKIDLQEPT